MALIDDFTHQDLIKLNKRINKAVALERLRKDLEKFSDLVIVVNPVTDPTDLTVTTDNINQLKRRLIKIGTSTGPMPTKFSKENVELEGRDDTINDLTEGRLDIEYLYQNFSITIVQA